MLLIETGAVDDFQLVSQNSALKWVVEMLRRLIIGMPAPFEGAGLNLQVH